MIGLAVAGLAVSATVGIYALAENAIPDPQKSDIKTTVKFIMEDQKFLEMNSRDRRKFVDSVVNRFAAMNGQERAEAADSYKLLRRRDKTRSKIFWMTFISNKSDEYDKLSPQKKTQYIDKFIGRMEMIGMSGRMRRGYEKMLSSQCSRQVLEKRLARNKPNVKLLLEKTTAVERAKISRMTKDVIERLHYRYR